MARLETVKDKIMPNSDGAGFITDQDFDALKADVASIQGDFKQLLADVSSIAKEGSKRSLEKSKVNAEKVREQFLDSRHKVEGQIREKPLTSVAVAVGVGALIAMLAKR